MEKPSTGLAESQPSDLHGIALVHRIPPVGLKCVSEKRRREMTALLGGEQGSRRAGVQLAPYVGSRPLLRGRSSDEERF